MPAIPDISDKTVLMALRAITETIETWTGEIGSAGNELLTRSQLDTAFKSADFTFIDVGKEGEVYLGDQAASGSWRMKRDGSNLIFQRYESGAWVTKSTITP